MNIKDYFSFIEIKTYNNTYISIDFKNKYEELKICFENNGSNLTSVEVYTKKVGYVWIIDFNKESLIIVNIKKYKIFN